MSHRNKECLMTREDRRTALSLALEKQQRAGKGGPNIGGLRMKKRDGSSGFGWDVAQLLDARNGSVQWDLNDPKNGVDVFDTIYEYMAAEIHAPQATTRIRVEAAQEYAHEVRSGVTTLANWLEDQWGIPLFRCQCAGAGNKVTAITVDPYVVVDESTGMTASESQKRRDRKSLEGVARAAYTRIGRQFGELEAGKALRDAVDSALSQHLPEPRMKQLEGQGDTSAEAVESQS
jgi:hypothetical protein